MTYENHYLIHLLSCAIRGKTPHPPEREVDWKVIHNTAEKQKVCPLIYESVCKLGREFLPEPNLKELWEKESIGCAYFFALQIEQIRNVLKTAEKNKLDMIVLKGTLLREFYPVPELRTMNDCDVIIKKEDNKKAKKVFTDCGYSIKREDERTIEFEKKDALKFEVFYSVFSRLRPDKDFDKDLWKDAENFMGEHILKPSPDKFFVHTIAHLAKHFITRGAGIRNLADIVLLAEKTDVNWQNVLSDIKKLHLEKFFFGIMKVAEKYFGLKLMFDCPDVDEITVEETAEFMLSNGVYGLTDNTFSSDAKKADGNKIKRKINYLKKIFPPKHKLAEKYNYAVRCPLLLPVAWLHRFYVVMVKGKVSFKKGAHLMKSATENADKHLKILDSFELWYDG